MGTLNIKPVLNSHSNKLKNAYELVEDFSYEINGNVRWVPRFFQYDGASIPIAAYYLVGTPFNPRYMQAALVHDWLYHTHEVSRSDADNLFYVMLCESGVRTSTALIIKFAVDKFGASYWRNNDDDLAYKQELEDRIRADGRSPSVYGL
ncbi:DUF1353 domain-containing protein [Pseudoalteromonas luteoviolacea]|uniref:DUF1353 domain-containing protein n=1 Tax=Pseudoalteromonas luteoviolacea TaxID=43657 RepID=UPI001B39D9D5|nr:DUF1353 domain-containing protein [Pseudoalteromonas luteoviolacea]MBQ4880254.1 DUF1353 domain-containing protein [Pseudoalteromonas luteoviolacea]MBQ4909315.1 DUF1353 domain-containing protein [Pseudoalteromonas luteoviolacea]